MQLIHILNLIRWHSHMKTEPEINVGRAIWYVENLRGFQQFYFMTDNFFIPFFFLVIVG